MKYLMYLLSDKSFVLLMARVYKGLILNGLKLMLRLEKY